ncbi:MAG: HNH endonuclease [Chloroflexi bacterium]|nr:HNH endonuclease [Chloroflexota bacterium]
MARISEPDLVLPALYVIQKQPGITTAELISELRNIFIPTGEDAEILHGRNDDKFSQIVRNLVPHHTLDQRLGYTILGVSETMNSSHRLSEKGLSYLQDNLLSVESLFSNNFGYAETVYGIAEINTSRVAGKKITIFDENIFIFEGRRRAVTTQVYERSKLLRDKAIDFYTKNGIIVCEACGFDFYKIYGDIGRGYIEIHHQKPVFQYDEIDFSRLIAEALKDLIPLCANCHRMIHRKKDRPLSIQELREILAAQSS